MNPYSEPDYYVRVDGKFAGPISGEHVGELLAAGKVDEKTPCVSASRPDFQFVGQAVHGMFWAPPAPEPPKIEEPLPALKLKPQIVRNRGVYIILGLLFGGFGFHNFYAGHHEMGAVKCVCSVVATPTCLLEPLIGGAVLACMMLWSIAEVITVTDDADGQPMA